MTSDMDDLVDAVLQASRSLVAVSARSIAGAKDVTLPQFRMLVVLDGGPTHLTALAQALDVAPSTAMRMVDRLEAHGLLTRSPHPQDRRQTLLELTPRGRRTVSTVTERRRRDLRAVLELVPPHERVGIAPALTAFAAAAEQLWPTAAGAAQAEGAPPPVRPRDQGNARP